MSQQAVDEEQKQNVKVITIWANSDSGHLYKRYLYLRLCKNGNRFRKKAPIDQINKF